MGYVLTSTTTPHTTSAAPVARLVRPAIYDRMNASAKSLGGEVIAREQNLDQLFATGHVTPDRLAAETEALGALQGNLRSVHLTAHLEMRAPLTPEQIANYQQLRGYAQHHHAG